MNKTELWNRQCQVDPAKTKRFKGPGGFEGTAINATHLIKRATEEWGPMGIYHKEGVVMGWGPVPTEEKIVEYPNGERAHVLQISFYWPDPDGGPSRAIVAFGSTPVVSVSRDGNTRVDQDWAKKSLTDAVTKALSWLGFGAEVHEGLYDDNKYVQQVSDNFTNVKLLNLEKDVENAVSAEEFPGLVRRWENLGRPTRLVSGLKAAKERLGVE